MYNKPWKLKNKFTICLSDKDIDKLKHMSELKEQNPSSYLRLLLKNDYDKNVK